MQLHVCNQDAKECEEKLSRCKPNILYNIYSYWLYLNHITWKIERLQEELEDTKRVIRIRKSEKNRQNYGQKKKYKRTNNDLQNIRMKLQI